VLCSAVKVWVDRHARHGGCIGLHGIARERHAGYAGFIGIATWSISIEVPIAYDGCVLKSRQVASSRLLSDVGLML